jgi:hypothetical protein
MSVQVKRRRDTAANVAAYTGAQGELIVDTTNNRVTVHDGVTPGGWAAAKLSEVPVNSRTAVADANYAALTTDRVVAYTALTAPRTITLPAATAFPQGAVLRVVDESGACSAANTLTISRAGTDQIVGGSAFVLNGAYQAVALESNGSNAWGIVESGPNDTFSLLGIGTAPDPSNPLSVYGSSALFNGANFNFVVNKSASANSASVIFQDGFSGRAQIGLTGSDNLSFKTSANGSNWTTAIALDAATGVPTFANQRTAVSDAVYTVLTTDRLVAYTALTGARAVSLPTAASFPAGQQLTIIDESGACSLTNALNVNPNGTDTINGLSTAILSTAYARLALESNGANRWIVIGRSVNFKIFTAPGTYVPTPGLTFAEVCVIGGGGGGGGGALVAASTAASGGGGGGTSSAYRETFPAGALGSSVTVTIGAGGSAGAAATSTGANGGAGGQGGVTSFGSLLQSGGGGGGAGGQIGAASGGGGGGGNGSGTSGSGSTAGAAGNFAQGGGSGASGGSSSNASGSGGGGGGSTGAAFGGGSSLCAPTGGASGGGFNASNGTNSGGSGGSSTSRNVSGGSGGAASTNGSAGNSASPSTAPLSRMVGTGGGGGGSGVSNGGAGGAGGNYGAGGGGGGSAQNGGTAGPGGAGAPGLCVVVEYF